MGNKNLQRIFTVVICGVAASFLTLPAMARDNGTPVDVHTVITGIHEVPAGSPLPGIHAEAKVNGKMVDIYIAPSDFVKRYDIRVAKGDEVHLIGTETAEGDADLVISREITKGTLDRRTGIFRENMTYYLRNDAGPLWE